MFIPGGQNETGEETEYTAYIIKDKDIVKMLKKYI